MVIHVCDKKSRLWSDAAQNARCLTRACSFCSSISRVFQDIRIVICSSIINVWFFITLDPYIAPGLCLNKNDMTMATLKQKDQKIHILILSILCCNKSSTCYTVNPMLRGISIGYRKMDALKIFKPDNPSSKLPYLKAICLLNCSDCILNFNQYRKQKRILTRHQR